MVRFFLCNFGCDEDRSRQSFHSFEINLQMLNRHLAPNFMICFATWLSIVDLYAQVGAHFPKHYHSVRCAFLCRLIKCHHVGWGSNFNTQQRSTRNLNNGFSTSPITPISVCYYLKLHSTITAFSGVDFLLKEAQYVDVWTS